MYSFFVGSDMSKDFFDISFLVDNKPVYLGQFSNDINGFKVAFKQLRAHTEDPYSSWFVCFENTGVYSKAFLEWLVSQGIACREENALKISKSLGLKRGKNDKIDSKDICMYAFEKRNTLQPSILPKPLIVKLKKLLSQRILLIKQRVALESSLKEQKSFLDPHFFDLLNNGNKTIIKAIKEQISTIELCIEETISKDDGAKMNHKLAQSVIGIGPINSAFLIAFTHNYSSFDDARKFACYAGTAPFPNQSGKRQGRSQVSHMANKTIKSLLSNAVFAAIRYDPQISHYYARKLDEGKDKGIVINAIKNKLIQRVFCVIKRQAPYVKLPVYA